MILQTQTNIIGQLLINNKLLITHYRELRENFFDNENKKIFVAIKELILNAYKATPQTINDKLKSNYPLLEWCSEATHIDDFGFEIAKLKNEYLSKRYSELALNIANKLNNSEENISDFILQEINNILDYSDFQKEKTIANVLVELTKKFELSQTDISGIHTGFKKLNGYMGGWQPSDLVIIAGRPAMGKTAFVTTSIINMAKENIKCVMFSLEMGTEQLIKRIISHYGILMNDLVNNKINNWENYNLIRTKILELPIKIFDKIFSLDEIILKSKQLKMQGECDIIIIDYLQLINNVKFGRNRENEVSDISRKLKLLAKELEVPVIALSQLNRATETRKDGVPKLSDLRESGAIEQDADVIGFLYRPEYYGKLHDENGNSLEGKAYLNIEKNRNGRLVNVEFNFIAEHTKFTENNYDNGTTF